MQTSRNGRRRHWQEMLKTRIHGGFQHTKYCMHTGRAGPRDMKRRVERALGSDAGLTNALRRRGAAESCSDRLRGRGIDAAAAANSRCRCAMHSDGSTTSRAHRRSLPACGSCENLCCCSSGPGAFDPLEAGEEVVRSASRLPPAPSAHESFSSSRWSSSSSSSVVSASKKRTRPHTESRRSSGGRRGAGGTILDACLEIEFSIGFCSSSVDMVRVPRLEFKFEWESLMKRSASSPIRVVNYLLIWGFDNYWRVYSYSAYNNHSEWYYTSHITTWFYWQSLINWEYMECRAIRDPKCASNGSRI